MKCPNCGAENQEIYKFCQQCGTKLPVSSTPTAAPVRSASFPNFWPQNPVQQATLIGAIGSAASGGLIILGWFTSWFGLSGIMNTLSRLLGYGSIGSFLGLGSGVLNGLQLTLLSLTASYAALRINEPLMGILALVIAIFLITIVIVGILFIRHAIALYQLNPNNPANNENKVLLIRSKLQSIRNLSTTLFIMLIIIFVIAAAIPFGTSVLGRGFYLTLIGTICGYVGALVAQNRIRM